jgi:transcription initiation factor IIE alpha subunit
MPKLENFTCPKCGKVIESEEYKPNKREGQDCWPGTT